TRGPAPWAAANNSGRRSIRSVASHIGDCLFSISWGDRTFGANADSSSPITHRPWSRRLFENGQHLRSPTYFPVSTLPPKHRSTTALGTASALHSARVGGFSAHATSRSAKTSDI